MDMNVSKILSSPFFTLGFSASFCESCKAMGFETLEDILLILPEQLVNKKGFNYSWLGELSVYLSNKGLLHLLQPIPGKSYD